MEDAAYLTQCGRFRKISMPVSVVRKCIKFYKAECLFLLGIKFNDAVHMSHFILLGRVIEETVCRWKDKD